MTIETWRSVQLEVVSSGWVFHRNPSRAAALEEIAAVVAALHLIHRSQPLAKREGDVPIRAVLEHRVKKNRWWFARIEELVARLREVG